MIKYIENSWDFSDSPSKIIKSAGWYVNIKEEPGFTKVVALFLGAGEYYSSNRNGDYFPEKELLSNYRTFMNGHHYKHHQNSDPEKSYGSVEQVYYNPDMHRVEGIIKIDNNKSPDMVEKVNNGEHVPLSMACKVPYDVCSICGHKSFKISEYCTHLKNMMNEILEDGRKVFAINENPDFFDISEVIRGADPTACVFRKVAASNEKKTNPIISKSISKKNKSLISAPIITSAPDLSTHLTEDLTKKSILESMASIEKQIDAVIDSNVTKYLKKGIGKEKLSSTKGIISKGALLRPSDFGLSGKTAMYNDLLNHPLRNAYLNIGPYDNDYGDVKDRSMKRAELEDRMINSSDGLVKFGCCHIKDEKLLKIAAINVNILYNNPDILSDKLALTVSILQNNII